MPVESPMCKNDLVIKVAECSQRSLSMDSGNVFLQLSKTKVAEFKYLLTVSEGFGIVPVPRFRRGWRLDYHTFCLNHIFSAQKKKKR